MPLQVLLVEDSEDDAFFVTRALESYGFEVTSERVDTSPELRDALEKRDWDIILSDYSMPEFDAMAALEVVQASHQKGVPFIIVSGAIGEETAVTAMKAGVHDYVLKSKLERLGPAVEREMRAARDRAQGEALERRLMHADRLAAIGQLAAGVAHEINNPLAFIIGNIEILGEHVATMRALIEACQRATSASESEELDEIRELLGTGDPEHALYDMHEIRMASMSGAERIASIVRDLRTFARIENDDVEMVKINEVVNTACNMVENTIRHKATLERELGEVPRFPGDRNKLTQTVVNLLVNAAQAVEDGDAAENRVMVTTRCDGTIVTLTVEDTGSGIPEVLRKQIFEPFFTTKSRDEGTGLGLALCADIIRKHRGQITVDSEPDKGTCFTLRIPLATGLRPTRRRDDGEGDEEVETSARILIVDDEPEVLQMYQRMLESEHEITSAGGGQEALDILRKDQNFDIILCDLMMPQVDGLMVYREVSERWQPLAERIVFITGGVFTARMNDFVANIGNRVLEKPISLKRLRRVVGGEFVKQAKASE